MAEGYNSEFAKAGLDQGGTHYVSPGGGRNQKFATFRDLLVEWQLRLGFANSHQLQEHCKLDGILSEQQWRDLCDGRALPGEFLSDYLYHAISKNVDIYPRSYQVILRKEDDLAARVEIEPVAYSILRDGLKEIARRSATQQPQDMRWPYPYAERSLAETVHSDYFRTLLAKLRGKYDPDATYSDYELLKLVGQAIDTNAKPKIHGKVRITPLMLMGFVRKPETVSLEELSSALENAVFGTEGDGDFYEETMKFYDAVKGIDLKTPFQSPDVFCESWEAFHIARINERRNFSKSTAAKYTTTGEELRLLEIRGTEKLAYTQLRTIGSTLNCYPSLDPVNKSVLRSLFGRNLDNNTFLGYLQSLIIKRGVSYGNMSKLLRENYLNASLNSEGTISRLFRNSEERSWGRHHLNELIYALTASNQEYTRVLHSHYKSKNSAKPLEDPIEQADIERLNALYLEYEQERRGQYKYSPLHRTYTTVFSYHGIPIKSLAESVYTRIRGAHRIKDASSAAGLVLACTQELNRFSKYEPGYAYPALRENNFLLGETWQFLWDKMAVKERDQLGFLRDILGTRPNSIKNTIINGKFEEYQRTAFTAGLSKIFQNALNEEHSLYNTMLEEQVMQQVLGVVGELPFKDEKLTGEAISITLSYLWHKQGLSPTPDNPKTKERIEFTLDLINARDVFRPYEARIIEKMAYDLTRSDKNFFSKFTTSLQERKQGR